MTVHDLETYLDELDSELKRDKIIRFIECRFHERYIDPILAIPEEKRHGFLMAAVSCLMIETLYCYRKGWEGTSFKMEPVGPGKGEEAFDQFLDHNSNHFEGLAEHSNFFYKDVRNGILHQGETYSGWKIHRQGKLYDMSSRTLNAALLFNGVIDSFNDYLSELRKSDFDSEVWKGIHRKLKYTIDNCKRR